MWNESLETSKNFKNDAAFYVKSQTNCKQKQVKNSTRRPQQSCETKKNLKTSKNIKNDAAFVSKPNQKCYAGSKAI